MKQIQPGHSPLTPSTRGINSTSQAMIENTEKKREFLSHLLTPRSHPAPQTTVSLVSVSTDVAHTHEHVGGRTKRHQHSSHVKAMHPHRGSLAEQQRPTSSTRTVTSTHGTGKTGRTKRDLDTDLTPFTTELKLDARSQCKTKNELNF